MLRVEVSPGEHRVIARLMRRSSGCPAAPSELHRRRHRKAVVGRRMAPGLLAYFGAFRRRNMGSYRSCRVRPAEFDERSPFRQNVFMLFVARCYPAASALRNGRGQVPQRLHRFEVNGRR
jgi:hypothetical protein